MAWAIANRKLPARLCKSKQQKSETCAEMKLFVTGIGTDVGKTVASAMLVRQLKTAYWKPVQAGAPTDSDEIRRLVGPDVEIVPEAYRLLHPASPHESAAREGIEIDLSVVVNTPLPERCIIEGAGGLLVPINKRQTVADMALALQAPLVIVVRYYLGCINHTLLTVDFCQSRNLPIAGLVLNGTPNEYSKEVILSRTGLPVLMEIPELEV